MSDRVFGITFARGGSKGLPGKNIRPLAGVPLIGHAIRASLATTSVERHFVSTDDEAIAAVAREYGAEVPFMRPAELAADTSAEIFAWKHAIETLRGLGHDFDVLVSVPATAPLRRSEDIDAAVAKLSETGADLVITVSRAQRSPYFNMVTLDPEGRARVVIDAGNIVRRQDAPVVYDIATVAYAARPDYVLGASSLFEGDVRAIEIPARTAIDIDGLLDFEFAEFLLNRGASE